MDKTTVSVKELSQMLGISLPKAYELVKNEIPHISVGSRLLIDTNILNEWIKNNSKI